MKKLYKVTSSTTTMFIADVEDPLGAARDLMLREHARSAVSREEENLAPVLEISEVKSLDDLPSGWNGHEGVWGVDEEVTAISWFNDRSEREKVKSLEEEVERLKEELYFYRQGARS
jgi:hypothetical protein